MAKSIYLVAFVLALSVSASKSPEFSEDYTISSFSQPPIALCNDIYYSSTVAYDPATGSIAKYNPTGPCTDNNNFFITESCQLWCIGTQNSQLTVNVFDSDANEITGSFIYAGNNSADFYLGNDAIVFADSNTNSFDVFNTESQSFECHVASQRFFGKAGDPWYVNDGVLFYTLDTGNQLSINYASCNNQPLDIIPYEVAQDVSIFTALNETSVFLLTYVNSTNNKKEIQAFTYSYPGNANFGTQISFSQIQQLNDTHVLILQSGTNAWGLYVIDADLNFLPVGSFAPEAFTGVTVTSIDVLQGANQLEIQYSDGVVFYYSFDSQSIVNVSYFSAPFKMSNGSLVQVAPTGYFIKNTNSFYYVSFPNVATYVSPSDTSNLYVLSTNDGVQCSILQFNGVANTITETIFPTCYFPASVVIKDVAVDPYTGNATVAYRSGSIGLYVVNISGSYQPFPQANIYLNTAVSLNISNNTAVVYGSLTSQVTIHSFYLSNGTIFNSYAFSTGIFNYVFRLTEQYALVAVPNISATQFITWDSVHYISYHTMVANVSLGVHALSFPFFALGASSANPAVYSGVVINIGTGIYIYNSAGSGVQIPVSGTVQNVVQDGLNSFFIETTGNFQNNLTHVSVTNWNIGSPEQGIETVIVAL